MIESKTNNLIFPKIHLFSEIPSENDLTRAGLIAFPFLLLYNPFIQPVVGIASSVKALGSFSELFQCIQENNEEELPFHVLQTTLFVAAVAATVLIHPLGILMLLGNEVFLEISHLEQLLEKGDTSEILESCTRILSNALFISVILYGGAPLFITYLSIQILLSIYLIQKELQKNRIPESAAHLLMILIRITLISNQYHLPEVK